MIGSSIEVMFNFVLSFLFYNNFFITMKIRLILFGLLLGMQAVFAMADDEVPALCIGSQNGEDQIELSEIRSIKYIEDDMVVCLKDGTTMVFAMDEIVVMELGSMVTYIRSAASQPEGNGSYRITDLSGKLVAKGKVKGNKQIALPAKKGIYVVTIGGQSQKVVVN